MQIGVAVAAVLWTLAARQMPRASLLLPTTVLSLGLLQIIPVPDLLLSLLSPLKHAAIEASGDAIDVSSWQCIAVRPDRTIATARQWLVLAFAVVISAELARTRSHRWVLVACIAAAGVAMLIVGLVASRNEHQALGFYDMDGPWASPYHGAGTGWVREVSVGGINCKRDQYQVGHVFGAFANANHFAAFMGVCLPVSIGLLLALLPRNKAAAGAIKVVAAGFAALVLYAVAIPAYSRGGTGAIVLSGLLVGIAALSPRRLRVRLLVITTAIVAAAITVALACFGPIPSVVTRFDTWMFALTVFEQAAIFGVGAGNFPEMARTASDDFIVYLAHNPYVQYLAESGIVGVALAVSFAMIALARMRTAWSGSAPQQTLRWGLVAALVFAGMHGMVDHGIQIPATSLLCCLVLGMLLASTDDHTARPKTVGRPRRGRDRLIRSAVLVVLFWVVVTASMQIQAAFLAAPLQDALADLARSQGDTPQNRLRLEAFLADTKRGSALGPDNAAHARFIAAAHLYLSGGEVNEHLILAEEWFARAVQLCPVDKWSVHTLRQIKARLDRDPDLGVTHGAAGGRPARRD